MTRAEAVAKRAMELAGRAEELARHAHEVAGVDDQLAALEAELDALAAEEENLDHGVDETEEPSAGDAQPGDISDDWVRWADAFAERIEALGDRLGDLVSGSVDAALHARDLDHWRSFGGRHSAESGRWPSESHETEKILDVSGPLPVKISSRGGSVSVAAGPPDQVIVQWRGRGRPGRGPGPDPVKLEQRDGGVLVELEELRSWRPRSVHLEVSVPAGSPIEITTGGGSVLVEGTAGPVRVRTGGGSISVREADGEVVVSTGGGSVRVKGRLRGESRIRTGGGSVEVVLAPESRIDVVARGTMASIDVPGLNVRGRYVTGSVGGGGEGTLDVTTGGGSVRIRQP